MELDFANDGVIHFKVKICESQGHNQMNSISKIYLVNVLNEADNESMPYRPEKKNVTCTVPQGVYDGLCCRHAILVERH